MKFTKIIGHSDNPKITAIIKEAENKISSILTELSLSYASRTKGTGWGGDTFMFQLLYPLPFYCDITALQLDELEERAEAIEKKKKNGEVLSDDDKMVFDKDVENFKKKMKGRVLRTAATDGRSYYINPVFINSLSRAGLRIVLAHEATHAIYLHPSRRGSRHPGLFNIAIDIKVNYGVMDDLRTRDVKEYEKVFIDNLGEFINIEEYAAMLRDPFNPPERLAHFSPIHNMREIVDPAYAHPGKDKKSMYYANVKLSDDMKKPENIYDYLYSQIPKCAKCGRVGMYKTPEEYKKLKKKAQEQQKEKEEEKEKEEKEKEKEEKKKDKSPSDKKDDQGDQPGNDKSDNHSHGDDGEPCGHDHGHEKDKGGGSGGQSSSDPSDGKDGESCNGDQPCDQCGNGGESEYIDPFGLGGNLVDYHMDTDVNEDELGKRLADAIEMAKRMGGTVPADLDRELGTLINPTVRWEDIVRETIRKKRTGYGKNDWTNPKRRPLFAGLYVPQKRDVFLKMLFAYDCSGSMSDEDIVLAISQLQVIDTKGEISMVGWDCNAYWSQMIKINRADKENLSKAKRVATGGTEVSAVFNEYEEHCGDLDMIIIATDGFLYDQEVSKAKPPPKSTSVLWLITSHNPGFKPPWGRVLHLRNEKL